MPPATDQGCGRGDHGVIVAREVAAAACMAPIEHTYARYAVGGALTVAAGSTVVIMAAPRVVARRHGLRDPGLATAAATVRLATFCAEVGIRRPPRLLVGPTSLRDAFSLGRPGRYAIAVPLALVVRPHTPLFEVAMRHELAHIRHHDVALSWLARSVWYTLAPLLLLPVVLFPLTGDVATLPGYLWRAAIIAIVVALAARSALRSRELSADVAAARRAGPDAVRAALTEVRAAAGPPLRRIMAVHPTRDDRIAAVRQPGRTAIVTMTDGAVVGFLAALALPVLDLFFVAVFAGSDGLTRPFEAASAMVLGPLAGATLGLGFWRQAVVARTDAQQAPVVPVLVGLAAGALAGQLGSLGGVGLPGASGLAHPVLGLIVAGALTGAAALTAGVGQIWADAVGAPLLRLLKPS